MNNTDFQLMGSSIRCVATDPVPVSDEQLLTRLAANPHDAQVLELLVDRHTWIIEDEVSLCFGIPPWFDSAVAVVFAAVVRETPCFNPGKHKAARWIRVQSMRFARAQANAIPNCCTNDGCIRFTSAGSLESLVTLLLENQRSPYWEDIHPRRPLFASGPRYSRLDGGSHVAG
jgi:hypothetical protein